MDYIWLKLSFFIRFNLFASTFDLVDVGTDRCIFETKTIILTKYLEVAPFTAQY